ncbi:unnamed protein product [Pieris brassicae]|uniref:Uncharacterized protein n=1 Tax=Pieris brassicae TaxID=7116 RepID=A0A9P0SZJ9_PIEBR|nr:unnamed protein product [Pieris brassicae]
MSINPGLQEPLDVKKHDPGQALGAAEADAHAQETSRRKVYSYSTLNDSDSAPQGWNIGIPSLLGVNSALLNVSLG